MATWYECKFKYNREDEKGGFVTISEIYMVDAVSFTEAEARIYHEVGSLYREFVLLSVSKYKIHELIFNENGPKWYKCKVAITSLDEKAGKEKKLKQTIMVSGSSVKEAYESVVDIFNTSISDFEILDIGTTGIIEVLPYHENAEKTAVDSISIPIEEIAQPASDESILNPIEDVVQPIEE